MDKKEVVWLIEHLVKACELDRKMAFNRKFGGKCKTHLLEVNCSCNERYVRLSKVTINQRFMFLVIPDGPKCSGWMNCEAVLSFFFIVSGAKVAWEFPFVGRQPRSSVDMRNCCSHPCARMAGEEDRRCSVVVSMGRWARSVIVTHKGDWLSVAGLMLSCWG